MSVVNEAIELINRWFSAETNKLNESSRPTAPELRSASPSDSDSGKGSSTSITPTSDRSQSPENNDHHEEELPSNVNIIISEKLNNSQVNSANDEVHNGENNDAPIVTDENGEQHETKHEALSTFELSIECGSGNILDSGMPSLETEKDSTHSSVDDSEVTCPEHENDNETRSEKKSSILSPLKIRTCIYQSDVDKMAQSFSKVSDASPTEVDEADVKKRVENVRKQWRQMSSDVWVYLQKVAKEHLEFNGEVTTPEEVPIPIGLFIEILEYTYSWNSHRLQRTLPSPPRCPFMANIPENVIIFFVKIIYARFGIENSNSNAADETEAMCT